MTQAISSAEFKQLYRYADITLLLDAGLIEQARSLHGSLEHFEATCRESGFRLLVAHVAEWMAQHGAAAKVVDDWVRIVGQGFQLADSSTFVRLVPDWLRVYMMWPDGQGVSGKPWDIFARVPAWQWLPEWLYAIVPSHGRDITRANPSTPEATDKRSEAQLPKQRPAASQTLTSLSQQQPEMTDPELLNARRYETPLLVTENVLWVDDGVADTVKEHIFAFGCRMTCLVMVLRDLGKSDVTISKLYRATYNAKQDDIAKRDNIESKSAKTIEQDLAQDDDHIEGPDIVQFNLQPDAGDDAVWAVSGNTYRVESVATYPPNTTEGLAAALRTGGPLIVKVKRANIDGHWIVVDSYNPDTGTFSIRDPNKPTDQVRKTDVKIPGPDYRLGDQVQRLTPATR